MTLGLNALVISANRQRTLSLLFWQNLSDSINLLRRKAWKKWQWIQSKLDRVKKSLKIEWFSWHDKRLMFPISFLGTLEVYASLAFLIHFCIKISCWAFMVGTAISHSWHRRNYNTKKLNNMHHTAQIGSIWHGSDIDASSPVLISLLVSK